MRIINMGINIDLFLHTTRQIYWIMCYRGGIVFVYIAQLFDLKQCFTSIDLHSHVNLRVFDLGQFYTCICIYCTGIQLEAVLYLCLYIPVFTGI